MVVANLSLDLNELAQKEDSWSKARRSSTEVTLTKAGKRCFNALLLMDRSLDHEHLPV